MPGEKSVKNNRVTRFADERINTMEIQVRIYRDEAEKSTNSAIVKRAMADALEIQIGNIKESLAKGNYENGNAQS